MALDDLLGKLVTVGDDRKRTAVTPYSSKNLLAADSAIEELRRMNIFSEEGQEAYKALTGEDPSEYSQRILVLNKEGRVNVGDSDLIIYVDANFKSAVDELDEKIQADLAYALCPTEKLEGTSEAYERTRRTVGDAKLVLEAIEKDPKAYAEGVLNERTPYMASVLAEHLNELLQIHSEEARENADLAIRGYKGNFLVDTKIADDKQANAREKSKKKLLEEMGEMITREQEKKGRLLNAQEQSGLLAEKQKDLQELEEKYVGVRAQGELASKVAPYVVATLRAKANAAEEAKKAKAAKAKKKVSRKKTPRRR